jgi:hypothetical protein
MRHATLTRLENFEFPFKESVMKFELYVAVHGKEGDTIAAPSARSKAKSPRGDDGTWRLPMPRPCRRRCASGMIAASG